MPVCSTSSNTLLADFIRATAAIAFAVAIVSPTSAQTSSQPVNGGAVAKSTKAGTAGHDPNAMLSMDMKKSMDSMSNEMASMQMTGDADRILRG